MAKECKYYKQKKQVSFDGGQTWQDVVPAEYQKGALYEQQSTDCGYVPPVTQYRWMKTNDTICEGTPEPIDYEKQYLTIVPREDGVLRFQVSNDDSTFQYSYDSGTTWLTGGRSTNIGATTGEKIMFKASLSPVTTIGERTGVGRFVPLPQYTFKYDVEGNVMSLLYGSSFYGKKSLAYDRYAFCGLFGILISPTEYQSRVVNANNLILPATTLSENCYQRMFNSCTTLQTAPELPATTLVSGCYQGMFAGCTSLQTAPELPATKLVRDCYASMFSKCTSLNYIKCLATDISYAPTGWLYRASSTGTFVTPSSTNWASGDSGIPTGWTRVDA